MSSKSAIVTGGIRGIGLGISQQLASDGYNLILGFNTNEEAASIAKSTIESTYGVKVYTVVLKLTLAKSKNIHQER